MTTLVLDIIGRQVHHGHAVQARSWINEVACRCSFHAWSGLVMLVPIKPIPMQNSHQRLAKLIIPRFTQFSYPPATRRTHIIQTSQSNPAYDFNNLFLFSLLFLRSTLFACIFSSSFCHLSCSSFLSLFALIPSIRRCLSASFSAFNSASLALVSLRIRACAVRAAKALCVLLVDGVKRGLGVCQSLPVGRC